MAAAVVEQQAPRVTSASMAGVRPMAEEARVGEAEVRERIFSNRAARTTPTAIPRPTPMETITIVMAGRNGSAMRPPGAMIRTAG